MASPQLENGHLKIANELIEAILSADLGRREQKVVWAVIRKTYGYNKKADAISTSQIAALTGIDRSDVAKTLRGLIQKRILLSGESSVFRHGMNVPNLSVNKDYESWESVGKSPAGTAGKSPPVGDSPPVGKTPAGTGGKSPAGTAGKSPTTKDRKDRKTDRSTKKKTGSNGQGRRIPEDFTLTPERVEVARKIGLRTIDAHHQFDRFRDHWKAASGQNARKCDWDAAWRNWCRKAVELRGDKPGTQEEPWYNRNTIN